MLEELPRGDDLSHVGDAALVDTITGWTRAAATVAHHRMAAIAELTARRCASEQAVERELWACDGWDSAAAEIAAASGISQRTASTHMLQAHALRHRLPMVAKLLADGALAEKLAHTISWRTRLIEDPDIMAAVDADLAATAASFGPLSVTKLENAIDAAILVHDPAAVLRFHTAAKSCDVKFGDVDDTTGTTSIWGRLTVADAELVKRRVTQLAANPCPHDPRTMGERRSAALGVISALGLRGAEDARLPCTCGRTDCTAPGPDARADAIVIHILTDTLPDAGPPPDPEPNSDPDRGPDAGPTPDTDPDPEPGPAEPEPDVEPSATSTAKHPPAPENRTTTPGLAVIAGCGIVPTPLLADLIRLGAPVRPVPNAAELCTEPHYRPSAMLARFVRNRDLTCCFPNCGRAAERCDLDHSTPYGPGGLTHPGNIKCLCRKHHLLKTFWIGPGGWTDQQLSDGTIVWISPTGHRYTRPPGSRLHFPRWDTTTPLPAGTRTPPATTSPDRGLTMPTRKYSRAQIRRQRLHAERQRNQRAIDEEPPPF
ncbi:HNH endonuclease signature motif containing protein [Mycobacterium sp. URHB0044]|uniref:HNH endonuclease signature motif containing protein n=1 Tax=Mycobacterium sp. URHB0044 TaxID=1380386 RepID=UPI000A7A2D85|nr:HNH endonuclease signature motif containing protein [Mycobacterium sp. URHB0044]